MSHGPSVENPYAPPHGVSLKDPHVEVVARSTFVRRDFAQVYRFRSSFDRQLITSMIRDFYLRQNTRIVATEGTTVTFERLATSVWHQFFRRSEKEVPQKIVVAIDGTQGDLVVTCHYQLQLLTPDIVIPPYDLETEVSQLARECTA